MLTSHQIRERIAAGDRFSLAEVRCWMADESDLERWCAVYKLLGPGWKMIRPAPDMEETCEFMTGYLLRCIHEDVQNDGGHVPTGYEAANDLADCLKHWASKLPETRSALVDAAHEIADAYLAASDGERDRLLNGFLEHALEKDSVRAFFERWKDDRVLGEPWRMAMEWAIAHEDH